MCDLLFFLSTEFLISMIIFYISRNSICFLFKSAWSFWAVFCSLLLFQVHLDSFTCFKNIYILDLIILASLDSQWNKFCCFLLLVSTTHNDLFPCVFCNLTMSSYLADPKGILGEGSIPPERIFIYFGQIPWATTILWYLSYFFRLVFLGPQKE